MPSMPTNDPLVDALRPLAAALVSAMRDSEGPRYYDAKNAPMGRTAFLRLAAEGAFPSFKVGKRVRALASDVHAYIERQQGARPRAPRAPFAAPPVDVNELSPAEAHELAMGRPLPERKK
jgi:predicted DNA-binding transcriptional regulator AlpA